MPVRPVRRRHTAQLIRAILGLLALGYAGTLAFAAGPGVGTQLESAGPGVPVWKVGDEWQYAYKGPSDSGTYVWSVDRVETLDGVPHYVIKSGTREIFDRVSDLANSLERVDGVVVLRETPSRLSYAWPLAVGKTWAQAHRQERPVERSTTDRNSVWSVESEETVTVPAGTFRTFKITWRNKNTGALIYEMWFAPAVKQWVKIREILANGIREREMIAFKLDKISTKPDARAAPSPGPRGPRGARPACRAPQRALASISGTVLPGEPGDEPGSYPGGRFPHPPDKAYLEPVTVLAAAAGGPTAATTAGGP